MSHSDWGDSVEVNLRQSLADLLNISKDDQRLDDFMMWLEMFIMEQAGKHD